MTSFASADLHPLSVARLVSDVLTRNRECPDFSVSVLTCSITYMCVVPHCDLSSSLNSERHRQHFRSDVLVTFNPPMKFTPKVCETCFLCDFLRSKYICLGEPRTPRPGRFRLYPRRHSTSAPADRFSDHRRTFLGSNSVCQACRSYLCPVGDIDDSRGLCTRNADFCRSIQAVRDTRRTI